MDLIELPKDKIRLGMALRYTLRDESGSVLLAKGHRIDTQQQLEGIRSRKRLFIEIEESEDAVRIMMSGLQELDRAGAPIKDFAKYLNVKRQDEDDKLSGSLFQRWSDVESRLAGLLASMSSTPDFAARILKLEQHVAALMAEDLSGSQFLLFNRSVTQFNGYSVLHSLLCASLVHSLADVFTIENEQRRSLVCAAMTMNVAMTQVQDELSQQKSPPSPQQRSVIDAHAAAGRKMLVDAGVSDPLWLDVVGRHHQPLDSTEPLASWSVPDRLTKILQTCDRFTAAMSPRRSRSGRTARDSVKTVIVQAGTNRHDEVGTALVRILGLSPPGTYVKLVNGETAVVLRRGVRPNEPLVAAVLNRNDEPIAEPRPRDTSREGMGIQSTLVATSVRINLKMDLMLRMIPRHA